MSRRGHSFLPLRRVAAGTEEETANESGRGMSEGTGIGLILVTVCLVLVIMLAVDR